MLKIIKHASYNAYKIFYLSKKNPHDIHLEFNLIYESYISTYIAFANGHNHPE